MTPTFGPEFASLIDEHEPPPNDDHAIATRLLHPPLSREDTDRVLELARELQEIAARTGAYISLHGSMDDLHGRADFHTQIGANPPCTDGLSALRSDTLPSGVVVTDYAVEGVGLRVFGGGT